MRGKKWCVRERRSAKTLLPNREDLIYGDGWGV